MKYINIVFQLAGLAIVVAVMHTLIEQSGRKEYAFLVLLGGIAAGLMILLPAVTELFQTVRSVFLIY